MNTPFRKLIRIAVILISVIILFNFFGYYLIRSRSEENEKMTVKINFAARQRMLSQTIVKDAVLLITLSQKNVVRDKARNNLQQDLLEFVDNNKYLRGEKKLDNLPTINNPDE